jgi:hypothetical protein
MIRLERTRRNFIKIVAAGLLAGTMTMASCSLLESEYVACADIRISDKADRALIPGTTSGQSAAVRVRRVITRCEATQAGYDLKIELGLTMRRDISENALEEDIPIDFTFAFLDRNDNVVSREIRSDKVTFVENRDSSRPVVDFSLKIPAGVRVVMGLGKAVENDS